MRVTLLSVVQKHVTVKSSVLEVLLEITKICDLYLMERVLDDESVVCAYLCINYFEIYSRLTYFIKALGFPEICIAFHGKRSNEHSAKLLLCCPARGAHLAVFFSNGDVIYGKFSIWIRVLEKKSALWDDPSP